MRSNKAYRLKLKLLKKPSLHDVLLLRLLQELGPLQHWPLPKNKYTIQTRVEFQDTSQDPHSSKKVASFALYTFTNHRSKSLNHLPHTAITNWDHASSVDGSCSRSSYFIFHRGLQNETMAARQPAKEILEPLHFHQLYHPTDPAWTKRWHSRPINPSKPKKKSVRPPTHMDRKHCPNPWAIDFFFGESNFITTDYYEWWKISQERANS